MLFVTASPRNILSNLQPTNTNNYAITWVINLIIIAYGIKSKVFKQPSSFRLHVNWLSVLHNYKHIPNGHHVIIITKKDSELSKRYFHHLYIRYRIFYIEDDNILKIFYLFTNFVLFYML